MNWSLPWSLALLLPALACCGQPAAFAQAVENPQPEIEQSLFNDKPTFLVAAQANHPTGEYRQGDHLSLTVSAEVEAYIYIHYHTATGETYQVFPNQLQKNNLVPARQSVQVPAEKDLFRWRVGAPYGKEIVKVIATKQPVDILSKPGLTQARFNRVNAQDLKDVATQLTKDQKVEWGETDLTLHTYQDQRPPEVAQARRFGVFFGVSKHRYNDILIRGRAADVSEAKASHDLSACHHDAEKLSAALRTLGRLEEVKVYTNEQATKANMEEAITRWLPSVSKPGDTVVIHFSGHGGQMPDRSGDEADGKDEYLVPHDIFGPGEFMAMQKLFNEDKLSPAERQEFEQYRRFVQKAGKDAGLDLLEKTAVTDDLLARWVQRLDGRQIVFIADACKSGGFVAEEQQFKSFDDESLIDFFQGEAVRLKNLGQGNHAMLSAAYTNENALERPTKDLGVLTSSILTFLNQSRGPQRLEDCFEFCKTDMAKYFTNWNRKLEAAGSKHRIKPSHPFLLNHCEAPVYLKP